MLYFAHGGIDDGHPDEPVTGTPDIHTPPLPQTTTTAAESSPTSGPWLPLTGLVAGVFVLIIVIAAVLLTSRHKHSN